MNLWSWILFPRSRIFERSGRRPSFADDVPRGRSRAICLIRARSVNEAFVRELCAIRVSFCAPSARDVLIGTGFEPLPFFMRSFRRSRVRFPGLIVCVWPVRSLAYVTRPHEWSNRWLRKQKKTPMEVKKGVCMAGCPFVL